MTNRRILAIGSQCDALGQLTFLPQLADDLFRILIDSKVGNCIPVFDDPKSSLVLDPTVQELKAVLRKAFTSAAKDQATLFIAYIGHGTYCGKDFFLLPTDAEAEPTSNTAVNLVNEVVDLYRKFSTIDGLVVLLDTCHAGLAAQSAAGKWTEALEGDLRFEMLTASGAHSAADGCFTQNLIRAMRTGLPAVTREYLRCEDLHNVVKTSCPNQKAQHPAYNPDDGLYISRNKRRAERNRPWIDSIASAQIEKLTAFFVATDQLRPTVEATQMNQIVVIEGSAGTGKSTLAAALAYPEITDDTVPPSLVQAIVFLDEGMTPELLAMRLFKHLETSIPNFESEQDHFRASCDELEFSKLNAIDRLIFGPLGRIPSARPILIVLDSMESLAPDLRIEVEASIQKLQNDPRLRNVHVLVTSRSGGVVPFTNAFRLELNSPAPARFLSYFERRGVPSNLQPAIIERAGGNWLVTRLLCDKVIFHPSLRPEQLSGDIDELYDSLLTDIGCDNPSRWEILRPVLQVLALAGVGPILPIELLRQASANLEGPAETFAIRNTLAKIRPLIVRNAAGTPDERCGMFHQTFVDYLGHRFAREGLPSATAHTAIIAAIDLLAPAHDHQRKMTDLLYRYAYASELNHLWGSGQIERMIDSFELRRSANPTDALAQWQMWPDKISGALGYEHEHAIAARKVMAELLGQAGNIEEALYRLEREGDTSANALGPDHPLTLGLRGSVSYFMAERGRYEDALAIAKSLLTDRQRVLGEYHHKTLATKSNIASWTGEVSGATEAVTLFKSLLKEQEQTAPDSKCSLDVLITRNNIAHWVGETGDVQGALRLYERLLNDQTSCLGPDHEDTLLTRQNTAAWKNEAGQLSDSLQLNQSLLPDRRRILGDKHPDTLVTRMAIAVTVGEIGDARRSLTLLNTLLRDMRRIIGEKHSDTLAVRHKIATFTAALGNVKVSLRLFEDLLKDLDDILGSNHIVTIKTRESFALITGEHVDPRIGLGLFEDNLQTIRTRRLSNDTQVLNARKNVADWTARIGQREKAVTMYIELLSDLRKVYSENHPLLLNARRDLIVLTHDLEMDDQATTKLDDVLRDQEAVLGPDHTDVVKTRRVLADWEDSSNKPH